MAGYKASDIEKIIYEFIPEASGYASPVIEAMNYSYKAGGKRLRPMLMKLCYDMYADGNMDERVIGSFMSAIEMVHTYSLIHDDLPALDNDELRRGKPTCHIKFGEDMAILAGDGLLNYAYEVAANAFGYMPGNVSVEKAFKILASKPGIYGMIGGQTLDVYKNGTRLSKDELLYIYENKTAALIEASMMIGALLGGAADDEVEKIRRAAYAVGIAFQVQDDILDIIGDASVLGKNVLSDEKNEKCTFVTLYGMDEAKAYVRDMSDNANELLNGLVVKDETAKEELIKVISALIDRDR